MSISRPIKERNTEDLIPYINNARTHDETQINQVASSIKEFGFLNPVIIDGQNGIIAGHCRILAAKKLGLKTIPCLEAGHLTEAQKKAYIIADNKLALNAGWDNEILKIELSILDEFDCDLSLTGFSDEELNSFNINGNDSEYDDDADGEITSPPEYPITKEGDVWVLGKHRLMCGDSCSITDMEKLMHGELVDMWLTDPPYNVAYEGKTKDALKIKNDSMDDQKFREFLRDAYLTADTVMKAGAVFYIWHSDIEAYNFRGAAIDVDWNIRQCLIWNKNSIVLGRQDYHWKHEPCLYGWKKGASHLWASDRKQSTVLEFNKPQRNGEHPTMKPIELFEYCMLNNTKGDDVVLDSFGGSGTTVIAAEKNNRCARLMELDPKYCDVIIKRWQTITGQDARLESTGEAFNTMVV